MKYKKGDIVCLFDGRTVYVFDVDNKEKESDDSSLNWSDVFNIGIITALICFVAWVICFFIVGN